jgi:hypothetical protein
LWQMPAAKAEGNSGVAVCLKRLLKRRQNERPEP